MTTPSLQTCPADTLAKRTGWPLERVLFAMAGTVVLIASVLTLTLNQWLFVTFGDCPASLVLTRVFHLQRSTPR